MGSCFCPNAYIFFSKKDSLSFSGTFILCAILSPVSASKRIKGIVRFPSRILKISVTSISSAIGLDSEANVSVANAHTSIFSCSSRANSFTNRSDKKSVKKHIKIARLTKK